MPFPNPLSPVSTLPSPHASRSISAEQLNTDCRCSSLNRQALRAELNSFSDGDHLYRMLTEQRPYLFTDSPVFLSRQHFDQQRRIIAALETTIALPGYQEQVLRHAPEAAHFLPKASGVFLGYDFHLDADGPKLIEINSNAGGAMVNALLIRAQNRCCEVVDHQQAGTLPDRPQADIEQSFLEMFRQEWQAERDHAVLNSIAIVDEDPANQYMLPEFLLFQQLFESQGFRAVICDPAELSHRDHALWHGELKIDLVYDRLTDFGLETPACQALRAAYLAGDAVVTPHPRNHALYADKRNLVWLGDDDFLRTIGVDAASRTILRQGIAQTVLVKPEDQDALWAKRKQLFFKPAKGYGSKAAYRGDKLTRRVFEEILQHDYVAQSVVKPSERHLDSGDLKLDLRHYVYQGQTQLVCARLYQGQTTNFRTPGGGFAQVVIVD